MGYLGGEFLIENGIVVLFVVVALLFWVWNLHIVNQIDHLEDRVEWLQSKLYEYHKEH